MKPNWRRIRKETSVADPGGGSGGPGPPSDLTLVWDRNPYIDRIAYHFLTGWFFLMKRALHFSTKLNSMDIQKCNCVWVPSYDLFASARKAVFPAPTATGFHRLSNTWSSLWEEIWHKKSSTVLSEPKFAPRPLIKNSWIRPWKSLNKI